MAELDRRCKANPRYSLRAFASALEINPAMLSMVISGKRNISTAMAKKIANKLGLNPQQTAALVKGAAAKKGLATPTSTYRDISLDQFAIISDWYHYAILSLTETVDFKPSTAWISKRLGISQMTVKAAVERLVRLSILDITSAKWKQIGPPIMLENAISTGATRSLHTQVLVKAKESLDNDSPKIRDISAITLAINPNDMPLAIEEIRKFKIYLMDLLEENNSPEEVYHLAIQLYPVTKKSKRKT